MTLGEIKEFIKDFDESFDDQEVVFLTAHVKFVEDHTLEEHESDRPEVDYTHHAISTIFHTEDEKVFHLVDYSGSVIMDIFDSPENDESSENKEIEDKPTKGVEFNKPGFTSLS